MFEYIVTLIWGIVVGFAVAVPIGPVGLICIQRTLAKNKISGLVSGLGAALADASLAFVGAFSITAISSLIAREHSMFRIIGGTLLLFLGIMALISKPDAQNVKVDTALGFIEQFLSAFVLTITNPLSAFSFFIAFGLINEKIGYGFHISTIFVIGAFLGSCLWWILLTWLTDLLAHKIKDNHIVLINKTFAIIITILGAVILLNALFRYF